jgi:hypothetical protein
MPLAPVMVVMRMALWVPAQARAARVPAFNVAKVQMQRNAEMHSSSRASNSCCESEL